MELLDKIETSFKNMIISEKVDLSVINILEEFKRNLIKFKDQFLISQNISDAFPVFHAIGTQLRIVDYMINRLNLAPKIHDNPIVAEDALLMIPQLKLINESLNVPTIKLDSYYIMELSSKIQILAMKNNMYPPSEKVIKSISQMNLLHNNFNRFADNVGEEIERV